MFSHIVESSGKTPGGTIGRSHLHGKGVPPPARTSVGRSDYLGHLTTWRSRLILVLVCAYSNFEALLLARNPLAPVWMSGEEARCSPPRRPRVLASPRHYFPKKPRYIALIDNPVPVTLHKYNPQ